MYHILLLLALVSFSDIFGFVATSLRLRAHTSKGKVVHIAQSIFFKGGVITAPKGVDIKCEELKGNVQLVAPKVKIVANDFNPTNVTIKITAHDAQEPILIVTNTPAEKVHSLIRTNQPVVVEKLGRPFRFDANHNQHKIPATSNVRSVSPSSSTSGDTIQFYHVVERATQTDLTAEQIDELEHRLALLQVAISPTRLGQVGASSIID